MKKTLSIMLALSFIYCNTKAQFTKGTVMFGTTIATTGYSSSNSDYNYDAGNSRTTGSKAFTVSAGPQVGIFLSPHLVLGATTSVNFSTSHVTNTYLSATDAQTGNKTNTTTTTVSIGPYLRDYFAMLNKNNWLYLQINGAVGTGKGSSSGSGYSATNTTNSDGKVSGIFNWNAGGSAGLTHLFYKRVGLDIAVGYLYNHAHNKNLSNTNTINKNTGSAEENSTSYTLNTTTNGITFGAGLHWFLRG